MKKKILLVLMAFVLLGSLVAGSWDKPAAAEKVYKWKWESFLGTAETEHSVEFAKFCEMVEENTNGQVKITLFPVGAIVKSDELMSATRDGIIEMSTISCAYGKGAIPLLGVIDGLPFSWRNGRELAEILYYFGLQELSRPAYEKYGLHLLGHHVQSSCGLGMLAKRPIRTLNDLKGLKLRSHGWFLDFWTNLGAASVAIPLSEAYTAAATGVVDAVTCDWMGHITVPGTAEAFKGKYGVLPSMIGCTGGNIVVNAKAWNSLTDDLKTTITLTWWQWAHRHWIYWHPYERATFESVKKMLEVAMAMWDKVAASDALCAKGVDIIKSYYRKIGRIK
jgi:TRAP-type C4-dicarboxylate transport system substrate-binding protein